MNDKTATACVVPSWLATATDLAADGASNISAELRGLLADVFALYLKTKSFCWQISYSHSEEYHLMLGEQAAQIEAMTGPVAARTRQIGGKAITSIGQISKTQRGFDSDVNFVKPGDMLAELRWDNQSLIRIMRQIRSACIGSGDIATSGLLEVWIDEAEQRKWILYETTRS